MTDTKHEKPASKPAPKLTGAQLRKLRALGHALDPVIAIGKEGITDALVRAADGALATHELIKVKVHREAPTDRHEGAIELAARTGAVLAQVIGRIALLYRERPLEEEKSGKSGKSGKKKPAAKKPKARIDLSKRALRDEKVGKRTANRAAEAARRAQAREEAGDGAGGEPVDPDGDFDDEDGDNLVEE
jgi:RNA-binding protein